MLSSRRLAHGVHRNQFCFFHAFGISSPSPVSDLMTAVCRRHCRTSAHGSAAFREDYFNKSQGWVRQNQSSVLHFCLLPRRYRRVSRLKRGTIGLPGGDRTPDPQLRRLMLYPTELRAVIFITRLLPGEVRRHERAFCTEARVAANHTVIRCRPLSTAGFTDNQKSGK